MAKNIYKSQNLKLFMTFLLAALFTLGACAENIEESVSGAAGPAESDVSTPIAFDILEKPGPFSENPQGMEQYRVVLQEGAVFYDTYDQKDMTLQQFQQRHSNENFTMEIPEIAAADLDRDGQLEIVLAYGKGEHDILGYKILRCQDDRMYGYSITYRSFQDLRTDGLFYGSGGAGCTYWNTIQFDAEGYTVNTFAHTEINYDSHRSEVLYFVGEENVSESAYYDRLSEWKKGKNGKKVKWYPFNNSSLEQIFTN